MHRAQCTSSGRFGTATLSVAILALTTGAAPIDLDTRAKARADAWMGREAGQLLTQLRVDGGRVQIVEDDRTLETRYTWSTRDEAWIEKIKVGGGELLYVESTGNGTRPVFAPIIYDEVHHPVAHRCDITYIADSEGVLRRWEHHGPKCADDIVGPVGRR